MARKVPAFAFDIDGVLVRGKDPLPGAAQTIKKLQSSDTPFMFLTNGGGLTEEKHTDKLAGRLGVSLDHQQFVQSHTPFHDLVIRYADKPVLVLGGTGDQIRSVAHAYGFKKVITDADVFVENPSVHPFPELTRDMLEESGRPWNKIGNMEGPINQTSIAAILVWSSPRDWCLDSQLVLDLLLSKDGVLGTRSPKNGNPDLDNHGYLQDNQPTLHFCNPDLEWATQFAQPRLAQGGFKASLLGIWAEKTGGANLRYTICGKPTALTYTFGEETLKRWATRERDTKSTTDKNSPKDKAEIGTVYMIGDNPESDIQGANNFVSKHGYVWKSILVESGVYVKGTMPKHTPTHTARNVEDAVAWALQDFEESEIST